MKNKGNNIKHAKLRGEWAEMRFMARAAEHGLQVSKPWGESASYDFVVEHGAQCVRVQVKSIMHERDRGHHCSVRGGSQGTYADNSFDFLAVYLISLDQWYIIPTAQVGGQKGLFLSPNLRNSKYGQYKEAWHLLHGKPRGGTVDRIEACAARIQLVTQEPAWL
jgi:PD-(D/E)XK endonuclease